MMQHIVNCMDVEMSPATVSWSCSCSCGSFVPLLHMVVSEFTTRNPPLTTQLNRYVHGCARCQVSCDVVFSHGSLGVFNMCMYMCLILLSPVFSIHRMVSYLIRMAFHNHIYIN